VDFIGALQIVADHLDSKAKKAKIVACKRLQSQGTQERLVTHKNYRGVSYGENHLEEWIAREPDALLGNTLQIIL